MALVAHNESNSYLSLRTDYEYGLGDGVDSMLWIRDWNSRSHYIFFAVICIAFIIVLLHSPKKVTLLNKTAVLTFIQSFSKQYFFNLF